MTNNSSFASFANFQNKTVLHTSTFTDTGRFHKTDSLASSRTGHVQFHCLPICLLLVILIIINIKTNNGTSQINLLTCLSAKLSVMKSAILLLGKRFSGDKISGDGFALPNPDFVHLQ